MNSCIVTSLFLYTQLSFFNHSFFIMYDYYCKPDLTSFSVRHHVNNYVFHLFVFLAIACISYMISTVCATVNRQIKQAPYPYLPKVAHINMRPCSGSAVKIYSHCMQCGQLVIFSGHVISTIFS